MLRFSLGRRDSGVEPSQKDAERPGLRRTAEQCDEFADPRMPSRIRWWPGLDVLIVWTGLSFVPE